MLSTPLVALAVASAVTIVQAAGFFATSCRPNFGILGTSNVTLFANCRNRAGSYADTTLDLNRCLVNYGGQLSCQANGSFALSCSDCFVDDRAVMYCLCDPWKKSRAMINLNDCVGNNDGVLTCD
ncbi:putative effector protein [Ceratobasidium theobromae]|uniref:Putative effector protein n=1 Tax=Ceratobasidium theobromae TaxID=1582974 RepID=A0A5N5QBM1_9AGAM|nr:putative effector protein [Ceratobasidium theobromae]